MKQTVKITENYLYLGERQEAMIGYIKYYINRNNVIVAQGTYVMPEHQNKGYAYQLFLALINLAREKEIKITTYCSYIHHYLNKDEFKKYRA